MSSSSVIPISLASGDLQLGLTWTILSVLVCTVIIAIVFVYFIFRHSCNGRAKRRRSSILPTNSRLSLQLSTTAPKRATNVEAPNSPHPKPQYKKIPTVSMYGGRRVSIVPMIPPQIPSDSGMPQPLNIRNGSINLDLENFLFIPVPTEADFKDIELPAPAARSEFFDKPISLYSSSLIHTFPKVSDSPSTTSEQLPPPVSNKYSAPDMPQLTHQPGFKVLNAASDTVSVQPGEDIKSSYGSVHSVTSPLSDKVSTKRNSLRSQTQGPKVTFGANSVVHPPVFNSPTSTSSSVRENYVTPNNASFPFSSKSQETGQGKWGQVNASVIQFSLPSPPYVEDSISPEPIPISKPHMLSTPPLARTAVEKNRKFNLSRSNSTNSVATFDPYEEVDVS